MNDTGTPCTNPVGWADVLTKHDLEEFADSYLTEVRGELAQLEARLVRWFVGTVLAVVGAVGFISSV